MTSDLEYRLRQRIDTLLDQRDNALEALEASRRERKKLHRRISDLIESRELWRHRAQQWRTRRSPN